MSTRTLLALVDVMRRFSFSANGVQALDAWRTGCYGLLLTDKAVAQLRALVTD